MRPFECRALISCVWALRSLSRTPHTPRHPVTRHARVVTRSQVSQCVGLEQTIKLAAARAADAADAPPGTPAAAHAPRTPGSTAGGGGGSAAPLRKRELVEEFGSKKARKKQKAEALRVVDAERIADPDALRADLVAAGADAAVGVAADAAAADAAPSARPHLPRFDLRATEPLDAYPAEALIPRALWPELPHARLLADIEAADDGAALAALARRDGCGRDGSRSETSAVEVAALHRTRDEAAGCASAPAARARQLVELRCALLCRHLLAFGGLPLAINPARAFRPRDGDAAGERGAQAAAGDDGGGEARAHPFAVRTGIPPQVWAHLLATFADAVTDEHGRPCHRRTDACQDRLACHTLALLLRLSRNALRLDLAVDALKLSKAKVTLYLRELGCTVGAVCPAHAPAGTEVKGGRYAELQLPLTFPVLKKKVQRAKK